MFNADFEQNQKVDTRNIFRVRKADEILSLDVYSKKIDSLKLESGMSSKIFDEFYWHLIANLTNYLQVLPDPRERNAALLHVALARAKVAFNHVKNHQDQRFQYAYISLAMFADLGVCLTDYEVLICDDEGAVLDCWHPFVRGLEDYIGYYYKVRPTNLYPKKMRYDANPVLACAIMPEFGLNFLKEDPQLFSQWLSALTGKDDAGDLSAVLNTDRAFPRSDLIVNLDPSLVSIDMCGDAEAFWQWLQTKLAHKNNFELSDDKKVMVEIDNMLKEYEKSGQKNISSIKSKLDKIKVLQEQKQKSQPSNVSRYSGFFAEKGARTSAVKSAVIGSVIASEKYIKQEASITESNERQQSARSLSENQNQQMT